MAILETNNTSFALAILILFSVVIPMRSVRSGLSQRKKDYAEYKNAKNEMRELLTVRANVERILNEPMEQRDEAAQKKQER